MKHTIKSTVAIVISLTFLLCLAACGATDPWATATYREDTELGTGAKTVTVEVVAKDQTVTFTIHTDKQTVGEALQEHDLLKGEEGAYGLYVKTVNGMTADYDKDQHYWAFYIDGEYALTGVDGTDITEGTTYRLEYAK